MAQLRAALGLGPGDEDVGTAQRYSGYEAQGEFLGFGWHEEVFASGQRGRKAECQSQMRLLSAFTRKDAVCLLCAFHKLQG